MADDDHFSSLGLIREMRINNGPESPASQGLIREMRINHGTES